MSLNVTHENVDLTLLRNKQRNILLIVIAISFFPVEVIARTLAILVRCGTDHIEMCTCDTRVLSRLFGPSRRRLSFPFLKLSSLSLIGRGCYSAQMHRTLIGCLLPASHH